MERFKRLWSLKFPFLVLTPPRHIHGTIIVRQETNIFNQFVWSLICPGSL